ncbi:MAG: RNA 2'-phosphotransferase [Pyrinomonadaceae bacterium]|nr:RNA 2'-phosphotransferase [Pyrinomonadaceae bacterium]
MKSDKELTKISKFLSLVLRHQPETIGLTLEENGWVKVTDLLNACAENGKTFTLEELRQVVETNDKQRFAFDESGEKIRANQGHSVTVEIEFEAKIPPEILYHGTGLKNVELIVETGLKKMNRHHVHLSDNLETARKVGLRHGKPVIFEVDTRTMLENDFVFFVSANGVWLVDNVPPQFLRQI